MTDFDKRVRRRTIHAYRIGISGVSQSLTGNRIVAELHGDQGGDFITLREAGRRYRVTLDIAELYRRGMIAEAAKKKAERKAARKAGR